MKINQVEKQEENEDLTKRLHVFLLQEKKSELVELCEAEGVYQSTFVREGIKLLKAIGEENLNDGVIKSIEVNVTKEDFDYVHRVAKEKGITVNKLLEKCIELRKQKYGERG